MRAVLQSGRAVIKGFGGTASRPVKVFERLVNSGNPVGEIIGIDSFMVKIKGLQPTNVHAVVRFEDETRGYVHHIYEDYVMVMKLDPTPLAVGMVCVIENDQLLALLAKIMSGAS